MVGAGAVTVTNKESPIFMAVLEKLLVAAAVCATVFRDSPEILKVEVTGVTVKLDAPVVPNAVAVNMAEPAPPDTPETTTESCPFKSVVPEVGVKEMLPTPDLANVTAAPETGLPAGFFAANTTVVGVVPSSGKLVPEAGVALTVEPVICIGNCMVTVPEVTVIVAVRFTPDGPAEKLAVATPCALVVAVLALNCPVDAEKETVSPVNTEFTELKVVAEIVTESEPSLLSEFALALTVREAVAATGVVAAGALAAGVVAVGVLAAGVVPAAGTSRPPQPTSANKRPLISKSCICLVWVICTETSDNIRPLHRDIAKRN